MICIMLVGMLWLNDDAKAEVSERIILDDETTSEDLYPYLDMLKDRARELPMMDWLKGDT